jgi:hypothetical protein
MMSTPVIGKACSVFKKGAVIGFKKEEIHVSANQTGLLLSAELVGKA